MNHLIKKGSKAATYFQMFGTPRMIRVMAAIWIHGLHPLVYTRRSRLGSAPTVEHGGVCIG